MPLSFMRGLHRMVVPDDVPIGPIWRRVDLAISGYGTNLIAPLMPIAMERKLTIMGIFGLANNEQYKYPNYFQISPNGPEPETSTALGFFELAARQSPKPQTVAIVGDAEYPQNALVGRAT